MTEDEVVGRHHRLRGHEFEQSLGGGDGQGGLAGCRPGGHKESDTAERLNSNKNRQPEEVGQLAKGRNSGTTSQGGNQAATKATVRGGEGQAQVPGGRPRDGASAGPHKGPQGAAPGAPESPGHRPSHARTVSCLQRPGARVLS